MGYNLDRFIVIDPGTGTYMGADGSILIDTVRLTEEEVEILNEGSDRDRAMLAYQRGCYLNDLVAPWQIEAAMKWEEENPCE